LGGFLDATVEIDVSGISTKEELHDILFRQLSFPDYYGCNWDAFDECIRDPDVQLPARVRVRGMGSLTERLPREAKLFRRCASDPQAIPIFEWFQ
jgi:RNAse (barnase) inhibitor barstar